MNYKHLRKGFLSAFDPFRPVPKRKETAKQREPYVIEGELRADVEAEALMHNAFAKALVDAQ